MKNLLYVKTAFLLLAFFAFFLVAQYMMTFSLEGKSASPEPVRPATAEEATPAGRLTEDKRVYHSHDGTKLEHVYITVYSEETNPENDITLYDLNESYKQYSNLESGPKLDVLFETGTAAGPASNSFLTAGSDSPNATIELRGRSSRREAQKSYKIRLKDNGGLWYGQNVLNLNKHADDRTRVRNKLAFDYFRSIPDFISLRTNFVQLHVKDLTDPEAGEGFEDYGLYTHIEQLNERALAARGLNPDGHLYKAENFEFHRYPDRLMHQDNPAYDAKTFETVLKINGNENHDELLQMLDDVNNLSLPFDSVFHKYFQKDNYLTWLATNILFGNYDTMSTNYYLYSPLNSEKWYFLPWDFDKALGRDLEMLAAPPEWQQGIQRYWGTVIHKRFLRDPGNAAALTAKIEELSSVINEESTRALIDEYYPVVHAAATRKPDLDYLNIEAAQFENEYRKLETVTDHYKKKYMESLEVPMPIFLHYERKNSKDIFTWEASHDLQEDPLTYHFQLSKTPDFSSVIASVEDAKGFTYEQASLPAGRYYWRVRIKDSSGHEQIPFDYYRNDNGFIYWGIQEIIVPGGTAS